MNAAPNFSSLLDEAPTTVESPKVLPAGTYHCVVRGSPRYDKSSKKQTPFVEFTLIPQSALEDVDESDLSAWATKASGDVRKLTDAAIKATYYETEDAIFMLDQFHEHCGIDLSVPMSRRNRNEEVQNSEVLVVLRHEASDDGQRIFARLARTASVV